MKKIFTLLFAVSIVSFSFAQGMQRHPGNGEDVSYHERGDWRKDDRGGDRYFYNYTRRELQADIAAINREYDNRICDVKDNRFMSFFRKQRMINRLQNERREEVSAAYAKFNDRRNRSEDCGPVKHW